jgi:hypothetical protein
MKCVTQWHSDTSFFHSSTFIKSQYLAAERLENFKQGTKFLSTLTTVMIFFVFKGKGHPQQAGVAQGVPGS